MCIRDSSPPFLHRVSSPSNSAEHCGVTAASADEPVETLPYVLVGWRRVLLEQHLRHEHPAVHAVAALKCLFVDEGLLHWMRPLRASEAVERHDFLSHRGGHWHGAGADGFAVDQH